MTILIGVDEAGRGPVIGPMVMCAFAINGNKVNELLDLDVKDSKLIAPLKRERLYEILTNKYDYVMKIVEPKEIDDALNDATINLNWLEAITSAKICDELIDNLNTTENITIILDCPSTNLNAYKDYFFNILKHKNVKLVVEHKADLNYPSASAASIIAKVTRDKIITSLKRKINIDFGSGYPADPKTKSFLEQNYDKYNFFRKSWESWKRLNKKNNSKQISLNKF